MFGYLIIDFVGLVSLSMSHSPYIWEAYSLAQSAKSPWYVVIKWNREALCVWCTISWLVCQVVVQEMGFKLNALVCGQSVHTPVIVLYWRWPLKRVVIHKIYYILIVYYTQNNVCFISAIGWNPASSYFTLLSNIYSDFEFVEQVQTMD